MKRSELFFGAALVPIDFLALVAAGMAAYYLRTSELVQSVRPAVFVLDLPLLEYLQLVIVVSAAIIVIFALQGLYAMQATRRLLDEQASIFAGISMGMMGVIAYTFLSAELFHSRFILLAAYIFALLLVSLGRWSMRRLQRLLLKKGYGVYRLVLIGDGRYSRQLFDFLKSRPSIGYRVVAVLPEVRRDVLENVWQQYGADELIQTDPTMPEGDNLALLDFSDKYKIGYSYVPNLFETYAAHVRFRQLGKVPLMELMRTPLDGWGRVVKRIMDLLGAVLGLIVLAPLFAVVAVLIKLNSPGPVFYRQERVGRNRQPFEIIKFRSMRTEYSVGARYGGETARKLEEKLRVSVNERLGPLFKMKRDPRVTGVGRILRRTRIDELPQLINVLKGEMSLLGPRPHLPQEVAGYNKYQGKLFTVKPGMSGMAQVQGNAGLSFDEEARMDIGYIENWSLWLDLVLLVKTFKILLTDKNAV